MSREQIVRDTAYAIWEAEGKPEGRDEEHWRLAEARVAQSLTAAPRKSQSRAKPSVVPSAAKPTGAKPAGAKSTSGKPRAPGRPGKPPA